MLNYLLRQINKALARGDEVEFAGGRLTRCERDGIGLFSGGDWPAHWQYWTVKWAPRWQTLVRMVGVEEARRRAEDFLFDEKFIQEWQGWERAERRREAKVRNQSRGKFGKGQKKGPQTGK